MRQKILDLFAGKKVELQPAFSGLIHITEAGLKSEGLIFNEIHKDAHKMAKAAASTFRLTGMPSAALPLDLCAPAEIFGAELSYLEGDVFQFPQVKRALFESVKEITSASPDIWKSGRLKVISEAIELVKNDIGSDIVISGLIPGPYTLLLYLCSPKNLFIEMKKEPESVLGALLIFSDFLARIGLAYKSAGADFITIHEMGGSPGFIGPAKFEQFVLPALEELIAITPPPCVLSVCGKTNNSMHLLAQTGAGAISVDQLNDLSASRVVLNDTLLFGNVDPVQTLWQGDSAQVEASVLQARAAGVDAVWPGCDLVVQTPLENVSQMK